MLLRQQHRLVISSSPILLMAFKHLLRPAPPSLPFKLSLSSFLTISAFPLKPSSRILPIPLKISTFPYTSHSNAPRPVYSKDLEETSSLSARLNILKKKLEVVGFETQMLKIGQHNHLMCPQCEGGDSTEKSLSLFITLDGMIEILLRGYVIEESVDGEVAYGPLQMASHLMEGLAKLAELFPKEKSQKRVWV